MKFTVNGKMRELTGEPTVGDYLRHLGVSQLAVAVELNGQIVKREAFDLTPIPAEGRLEVVRMMGGG
jgi:thiamine biosynthesis protein ThiS